VFAGALAMPVEAQAPRTINLTGQDSLLYSTSTITAKKGELLKIVLRTMSTQSPDQLKHNFVVLKPGVKLDTFIMDAAMDRKSNHLPAKYKPQIVAATDMAAAGETVTTTFRAPATPGAYPFVCSFPGHFNGGMKGTLIVK
jgi:azurin